MKLRAQNILLTFLTALLCFFSTTVTIFAQSGTDSTTSSSTSPAPLGLIIVGLICNAKKRNPIGGWLLFYYIQLFIGVILWLLFTLILMDTLAQNLNINYWDQIIQYILYLLTTIPSDILLFIELIFASMLLNKKFRNRKIYNWLRITIAATFGFSLLALAVDSYYWPENSIFDILAIVTSGAWLLYFTFSARARMVFIENNWDPDSIHPPKPKTVIEGS